MDSSRIEFLETEISKLPKGNITYKTINGKRYPYLQWKDDGGRQCCRIVKSDEKNELLSAITKRKEMEKELKEIRSSSSYRNGTGKAFFSEILTGDKLREFVRPVEKFRKRECFRYLSNYIDGESTGRVFILYGLRRTGKTTLMRQLIAQMPTHEFVKTAFIQVTAKSDIYSIDRDMKRLEEEGYRYVFLDEVTLLEDFISCASIFSDIYASCGMKIVLSGYDSLGFAFALDEELYDRAYILHTTFVPYRDFENVLGICGIDEYIRYGGTMSRGGINYNASGMTFSSKAMCDEYVDKAISMNIQHSLEKYQDGSHFRALGELNRKNELTGAINRVVEDINHRFTLDVLTKDFVSSDLSISRRNLLKDPSSPSDVLERENRNEVTEKLRKMLEIRNREEREIEIDEIHREEIKEYLDLMEVTADLSTRDITDPGRKETRTAVTQPGMRYSQAEALLGALMDDRAFMEISLSERNAVRERILGEIKGRMMEEIVSLETKKAFPDKDVFKLVFPVGEYDAVVFDPRSATCEIYEIKHSDKIVDMQRRHLLDEEKLRLTEHRYGKITGRYVIYRGKTTDVEGIRYLNVEEYLKGLGEKSCPI